MEEILKEMMGENFKSDMTKEDITKFFENSVISSGKVVPLEKFTNIEKLYKDSKNEVGKLNQQIESINNSKLSDDELKAKLDADNKKLIEGLQKQLIKTKVEKVFESNGIKTDEYSEFIESIVTSDEEKTLNSANGLVNMLKKQIEQQVKTELAEKLKEAGKLPNGEGSKKTDAKTEAQKIVEEMVSTVNDNRSVKAKEFYKK
jgi:hypothetical protein